MRLHAQTAMIENGFVHIPESVPWLAEYPHEISLFPKPRHSHSGSGGPRVPQPPSSHAVPGSSGLPSRRYRTDQRAVLYHACWLRIHSRSAARDRELLGLVILTQLQISVDQIVERVDTVFGSAAVLLRLLCGGIGIDRVLPLSERDVGAKARGCRAARWSRRPHSNAYRIDLAGDSLVEDAPSRPSVRPIKVAGKPSCSVT
jgi:hypothetical protein